MTIEDTRRLGIEFERRVQTMIPDTEFLEKLDTETIYSFLNQYQDKYVHEIYRNLDQIQSGSHLSAHVESVLQSLISEAEMLVANEENVIENTSTTIQIGEGTIGATGRSVSYKLPIDFYMYIRSVSQVSRTFAFRSSTNTVQEDTTLPIEDTTLPIRVIPNQLTSQSDVWKLIETPHNTLRILRYPAATLGNINNEKVLTVIYD